MGTLGLIADLLCQAWWQVLSDHHCGCLCRSVPPSTCQLEPRCVSGRLRMFSRGQTRAQQVPCWGLTVGLHTAVPFLETGPEPVACVPTPTGHKSKKATWLPAQNQTGFAGNACAGAARYLQAAGAQGASGDERVFMACCCSGQTVDNIKQRGRRRLR